MELMLEQEPTDRDHLDVIDEAFKVQTDRALCFHEAGHVVAMWAVGAKPGAAQVRPTRYGFEGEALFSIEGCHGVTLATLILTAAGPIASRIWDNTVPDGGEQDREDIERGLRALCRSTEAADIVRRHVEVEARRIIKDGWDAVEVIADALRGRGTLTGDDIAELMSQVETVRANAAEPGRRQRLAEMQARADSFATISKRIA